MCLPPPPMMYKLRRHRILSFHAQKRENGTAWNVLGLANANEPDYARNARSMSKYMEVKKSLNS
jgi:hypothetical protein